MVLDGSSLYVGGAFTVIGTQNRSRLAKLSTSGTGLADLDWNPNANNQIEAMEMRGPWIYAGGHFTTVGGQNRNRIARLNKTNGDADPDWDPDANGQVNDIVLNNDHIYVGGAFTFIGNQTRNRIADLDDAGDAVFTWDPNANSEVYTLELSSNLFLGGVFNMVDGLSHSGLAKLILPPGTVDVAPTAASTLDFALRSSPNPARARAEIRFALPEGGPVRLAVYDVAGRRVATLVDGTAMTAGPHQVAVDTARMGSGLYFARLEFGSRIATGKLMVVR